MLRGKVIYEMMGGTVSENSGVVVELIQIVNRLPSVYVLLSVHIRNVPRATSLVSRDDVAGTSRSDLL